MLLQVLLINLVHTSLSQLNQFYFGGIPSGNSLFPQVTLQAYKPRGLSISIRKSQDIVQLTNFEYSRNNGPQYTAHFENSPMDWLFFDPKIQLKVGDFVNYTMTIISHRFDPSRTFGNNNNLKLGLTFGVPQHMYTDTQIWKITALNSLCESQYAQLPANVACSEEAPVFDDDFSDGVLNRDLWSVEQYIPQYYEENYEFVSYQDINECVFLSDSKLYLKPIVVPNSQLQGTLDLTDRCSRNTTNACFHRRIGASYLPPVKSGKIVSNISFKYGKVEIRAKLPVGDWIFPLIELIPADLSRKYPKLLIAYSRGNRKLTTKEGREIGAHVLFGGYVTSTTDMKEFNHLKSIKLSQSLGDDMNIFTLTWTPDKIIVGVNGDTYGTTYQSTNDLHYKIALGVGVGGNVDFPDDTFSGSYAKPWKNDATKQVKDFVDAKNYWISSWVNNAVALQVDYVRVFAV